MNRKPRRTAHWRAPADLAEERGAHEKITAGIPLAKVIKRRLATEPELVMLTDSRSLAAEKFRRLKTTLEKRSDESPQVIVVTSATPNDGKSFVSMNLALAFAGEKRGEVLLIDSDLRRPSVHRWLSPAPAVGLAEILKGKTEVDHGLLSLDNSPLKILPAGRQPREPAELLASDEAAELLSSLRQQFQRIIIDTPPIVPFTDADIIGRLSDGFLLVARSGKTEKAAYKQAQSLMTSSQVLGMVLNDTAFTLADWNLRSSKYYNAYYEEARKK